jgi:hypothetical protein
VVLGKTKPFEVKILVGRYNMSDSSCRYSDKLSSVSVDHSGVTGLWGRCLIAGKGDTMNSRPLLDLLEKVLIVDKVIGSTVPGLEFGIGAAVAWVHRTDLVGPLLSRLYDSAVRTDTVGADGAGARRSSHASGSDARVAGSSSKAVWVCRSKHICHHASRAGAGDKDLLGIGIVLLDEVVDHANENLAVTLAVVLERLCAGNIPAVKVLRGGRENKYDTARIGERLVLGLLEISRSVSTAGVQLNIHNRPRSAQAL